MPSTWSFSQPSTCTALFSMCEGDIANKEWRMIVVKICLVKCLPNLKGLTISNFAGRLLVVLMSFARLKKSINHSLMRFNPLSPNSDQHQISPCNINACSTPEVMRINDMITQGEFC